MALLAALSTLSTAGPACETSRSGGDGDPPSGDDEPDAALCDIATSLVDHAAWRALGPAEDPYGAGPLRARCGDEALAVEIISGETSLSMTTRACSWGTVAQPTLEALAPGDRVKVRLWYFSQTLTEFAEAHVTIEVAAQGPLRFDWMLPVPSPGGLKVETLDVVAAIPAGTNARWHVDNHGDNSWNLLEVTKLRRAPCPTPE